MHHIGVSMLGFHMVFHHLRGGGLEFTLGALDDISRVPPHVSIQLTLVLAHFVTHSAGVLPPFMFMLHMECQFVFLISGKTTFTTFIRCQVQVLQVHMLS